MIFLNTEEFIREAIESVFAQRYEAWELLLVDDGSEDLSTTIAKSYADQYPRKVRYFEHARHENRGMSASRNLGIANSAGEYIAFLDSDDIWLPNKLQQQVSLLESQPKAAMVYGPTQWWYSWTGKPEDRSRDYIHALGVPPNTLQHPPVLVTNFLRMEGVSPCTCSVLLRRKVVEQVGGFEETFRGLYEDQAFFAKLCLSAPVYVSSVCSAKYRQHPKSSLSVNEQTGQYQSARPVFLNWLSAYLSKQGIQDAVVWQALHREMWPYQHPGLYRMYTIAREGLPGRISRKLRAYRTSWYSLPLLRQLRGLGLRRLAPFGDGKQRGTPIVRFDWDRFLKNHQKDIRGTALEIGTTATLHQYGGPAVTCAEAIDLTDHSPEITFAADLSRADVIPSDRYDCFINQFTMHLIYDLDAALYHAIRVLKPGGVLLINFPCVDYYFAHGLDMGTGEPFFLYWWFTPIQVENLLRRAGLQAADYQLEIYGNLFTRVAYQMNLPAEALTRRELEYQDPGHPLLICARIVKPAGWKAVKPAYQDAWRPEGAAARWNPVTGHYADLGSP